MNAVDLIVCLVLVLAVWNGWRQGFILQVCSLAGIVAGIWLAARFGTQGRANGCSWIPTSPPRAGSSRCSLRSSSSLPSPGRLVRRLFHFAGFGIADTLLGIAVSVLKYLLVLSALFSAFDTLNADYTLVSPETIEKSKSYKPVMRLSEAVFPFLEWVGEQVPGPDENTPADGE